MIVSGGSGGGPTAARRKPKLALRGRRRKSIKKLSHYLNVVLGEDNREASRAEKLLYSPYLFQGKPSGNVAKALALLQSRCAEVLSAKIS